MTALQLSRDYFEAVARPALQRDFPDVFTRAAVGLVGNGSECFGYDDEISRDHDWGVDFFIWVSESDRDIVEQLQAWKNKLLEDNPPPYARARSQYGATIGVMTPGDFYRSLVGYPDGPDAIRDWMRIPEENLAMATNGDVFMDNAGVFTSTREKLLRYYPEDLRKKKLAARCMALAQTGQYNLTRCFMRGDWVAYNATLARFSDAVIAAVFLLNKAFRPYYKWAFRRLTDLSILSNEAAPLLRELALTCTGTKASYEAARDIAERLCALIAEELRRQGLAQTNDDFLTAQAEQIQQSIQDDFLRALPTQYE